MFGDYLNTNKNLGEGGAKRSRDPLLAYYAQAFNSMPLPPGVVVQILDQVGTTPLLYNSCTETSYWSALLTNRWSIQ